MIYLREASHELDNHKQVHYSRNRCEFCEHNQILTSDNIKYEVSCDYDDNGTGKAIINHHEYGVYRSI